LWKKYQVIDEIIDGKELADLKNVKDRRKNMN
jgi:hypothetical protein